MSSASSDFQTGQERAAGVAPSTHARSSFDARLARACAGELGHLEFLQVFCHDEISRRDTTSIARRTRRARFEETLTLEGFDFAAAPKLPAAQIRDLAALRWLQAGESVILHGPVGIPGNSHPGCVDTSYRSVLPSGTTKW